jgi:hypothetical protein
MSPAVSVRADGSTDDLFASAYISMSVSVDGRPHAIFNRDPIFIDFHDRRLQDVALFEVDCNAFSAAVEIKRRRIEVGRIEGTEIGCPDERERRDRWIVRFLGSDPKWRTPDRDRLVLRSTGRVIRFSR